MPSNTYERMMGTPEPVSSTHRRKITFPEGLFLAALLVRLAWLVGMVKTPFWSTPLVDALTYHEMAIHISQVSWIPTAVFERTPLYPYIIAIVYAIAGPDLLWVRLLQSAVGAINVVLLYRLAARIFDENTGRLTGIIAAAYGMFWIHETDILAPVWVNLFLLLSFLFALPASDDKKTSAIHQQWIRPMLSGLSLGLAGLTWPTVFFAAPGVWHVVGRAMGRGGSLCPPAPTTKKIDWKRTGVVVAATLVLPIAIVVYQAIRFNEPMLSLQGGVNLYIGNNLTSDGYSAIMPGFGPAWKFEELQQALSRERGHYVSWHELDAFYRNKALAFMRDDPLSAAKLLSAKLFYLIMPTEIPNTFDPYILALAYPWARTALWCGWWLVLPLGIVGIVLRLHRPAVTSREKSNRIAEQGLMIAALGLSFGIILFFVNMRYRLPLAPLVIPFAAAMVMTLWRRRKQTKQVLVPLLSAAILLVLLRIDWVGYGGDGGTYGMTQLAISFRNERQYEQAEYWFSEALNVNPTYPGIRTELAHLAIRRNDFTTAKHYADGEVQASLVTPFKVDIASVFLNVGNIYAHIGMLDSAQWCFREALNRNPSYEKAQLNIWRIQLQRGARNFMNGDTTTALQLWEQVKKEVTNPQIKQSAEMLLTDFSKGVLKERLKSMTSLEEVGFE